jgi:hypothetical protein
MWGFCNMTMTFSSGYKSNRQCCDMSKTLIHRASAAALAASVALAAAVPAFAQPSGRYQDPQLEGAPPLFSGQDYRSHRGWGERDDWRRRKPDFQQMQRDCSRAGIQEAWSRSFYSAQYNNSPRLMEGRYGWELRGNMRLHNSRGYSYADTVCTANGRGGDVRFEFRR